jgi:hypothetical protein
MLTSIGTAPWTRDDMRAHLHEFADLYERRPIHDNTGGMKAPHAFLAWFAMKLLRPKIIIESGVFKGQGTWLMEQACPNAELFCLDIDFSRLVYRSSRATYIQRDFSLVDWRGIPKEDTVCFLDDHQDHLRRCKEAKWMGFRHMIFEDNYAPTNGADLYTLKMAFLGTGFKAGSKVYLRFWACRILGRPLYVPVQANTVDAEYLRENLDVYDEMPPVFAQPTTRWGDRWGTYPTPEPLLKTIDDEHLRIYESEAKDYTWMCYVRLKK